jgi:hypothetical protein
MFPHEWPVFIICCAYVELSLLYFIAYMCSLYLVQNVCPMHCRGQSMHFNLYMLLFSYLLVLCCFGFKCFCRVLVRATFRSVSLNILSIFCVSCPKYVSMTHFSCFWGFDFLCIQVCFV